jgi:outer membrane protein OmpU
VATVSLREIYMRKILLATTALIAAGGISAATADVNISGKLKQSYHNWSDDDAAASGTNNSAMGRDLQLWIKSSATLDNGMTVGGNVRLRHGNSPDDRNYITVGGDFGSFTYGTTWAPSYSQSVGINWMDDIHIVEHAAESTDGVTRGAVMTSSYSSTSGKAQKVIYATPSISGFKAMVSYADAGASSKGDHTGYSASYSNGPLKVMYAAEKADHADAASATEDTAVTQYGVQYSGGFGRVWALAMSDVNETNAGSETSNQSGNQVGIAYSLADNMTGVMYYTSAEETAGDNNDDEYSATALGVNYVVGGGLNLAVSHTMFDYTDATTGGTNSNDGSSTKLMMTLTF